MSPSMEAAPGIQPSLKERPLDKLQDAICRLQNNNPLEEGDLYKLSLFVQQKYGDAFPSSEEEELPPLLKWIEKKDGPKKFRELWEHKEEGEEFRNLCFRAIQEEDEKKQRALFEEMSQRLGDGMFREMMH